MFFLAVTLVIFILILVIQCGFKNILKGRQKEKSGEASITPFPAITLTDFLWVRWFGEGRMINFLTRIGHRDVINQFKLFNIRAIFINDLNLGQKVFKDPVFCKRPQFTPLSNYGVSGSFGKTWKEQRKFCSNHLKALGFGTKSMESYIQQERDILIENWRDLKGQRFSPNKAFYVPVLNCIWEIMTGERFSEKDQELVGQICTFYEYAQKNYSKTYNVPEFLGVFLLKLKSVRWLASSIPMLRVAQSIKEISVKMRAHFSKAIETRSKNLNMNRKPDNLIDDYLIEIRKTTDPESSFFGTTGEMNLQAVIMDFFIAGGDTTATSLAWAMLHLSRNPEIQEKIQNEIEASVGVGVGEERLPSRIDKTNCPYTEAFIWEVLRMNPSGAGSLPHAAARDTKVGQYLFEKNSLMIVNIYGIQHDPKIWEDPENFRPERFLSDDGKTFVRNEAVIPFSIGLRRCLGEHVALDVLFLFITGICQKFVLKPDPLLKGGLPKIRDQKSGIHTPEIYYIVAEERN